MMSRPIASLSGEKLMIQRIVTNGNDRWQRAFGMTPNTAAAERVFALLTLMFDQHQLLTLSDYLEGAVMSACNLHALA